MKEQYEKALSFRKRTCAKKKNAVGGSFFIFLPLHLQKLKGADEKR
jgi:hypothetical protein